MTDSTVLIDHPRLQRPTVFDVVFEMTFVGERPASEAFPIITKELSENFNRAAQRWIRRVETQEEQTNAEASEAKLSRIDPPPNEPQFKLHGDNHTIEFSFGGAFFQLLQGREYTGWNDFRSLLKKALTVHQDAAQLKEYTSLRLVFANRVEWTPGREDQILQDWALPTSPPLPGLKSVFFRQQRVIAEFPDGHHEIIVTAPGVDDEDSNEPVIQFDLLHFVTFSEAQPANIDNVMEWTEGAHERIYQTFHLLLRPEFLKEIS